MQTKYIILDRKEVDKKIVVNTFDEADAQLRTWARTAVHGGEDVEFFILWKDGGTFAGDYRLEYQERNPSLRSHLRRYLEFVGVFMTEEGRADAEARLV